jgi:phosphatidylglycerol lysyltransferase
VSDKLKQTLRHAPALLGLLLLFGAIYVVQREFHHLKVEDIARALQAIPFAALARAAAWTVLSYGILTLYDRLGTIYAGRPVSYRKVAFASFCAYALSHNLGFAAVSGAAVRYRLYAHWGLTPLQIGKVIAFCSLTFGLGGMVLGGAILFAEPTSVPFFGERLPHAVMYAIGAGLWGIDIVYVVIARTLGRIRLFGHDVQLPGLRMAILQVLLATVDVAVTAAIFYSLLPTGHGLNYLRFLGVYVASYTAGLLTNLPGGLGVFDTAMLLGLEPYLEAPQIVGAILVFRLYYYVIPLFLAGSLFATNEILLRSRALLRRPAARGEVGLAKPGLIRWSEPDFAVAAGAGAVALCGVLLLSLGVLEARPDFSWIDPDLAEVAVQAGEFVPSLIGAALVVLAIALSQRVNLAWGSTIVLLLLAATFTVAQGEPMWIPGVLVLATMLIAPYRGAFYRHTRLLSGPLQPATAVPLIALVVCVLVLAAFERHVRWLANNSWWEVVLSRDVPNSLRASVALTVLLALGAMWRLLRPRRVTWQPWNADARLRYAALGGVPPARADGIVWGEAGRAGVPFRRLGRVLLALGDPVGTDSDRISAVWRLRDLAQQEGRNPAVWWARASLLRVYADLGLSALLLGPDGLPSDAPETDDAHYLASLMERDLPALLPLLPGLDHVESRQAAE